MTLVLISHPDCARHNAGPMHPESPARLAAIKDALIAAQLDSLLTHHEAPAVTRPQLLRVHDADYVDELYRSSPEEGLVWLDPDTAMNPYTLRAAERAAGAVVLGVDLVLNGGAPAAFCCVRPPGHHATRGQAMGFCFFNNVAVGAAHALEAHGLKRVAIVDFDVHHGNGTEDIFRDEPRVLYCSTFQHPFYPHVRLADVPRNTIAIPLKAGSGSEEFRAAVKTDCLPRLRAFAPQLVLISAGFDAHVEDPLAELRLVEDDYAWVTTAIKQVAEETAGGRIVSSLEGGYALSALGRSVCAHLKALI